LYNDKKINKKLPELIICDICELAYLIIYLVYHVINLLKEIFELTAATILPFNDYLLNHLLVITSHLV